MRLHIGIDDTDSPQGGCTTYIAARLVEKLLNIGVRFVDYPNLLRLNPNVPWKTRGNGAVCLRIDLEKSKESLVKMAVLEEVEIGSEFSCENTNPGIVFFEGDILECLKTFSKKVVGDIVTLDEALKLIDGCGASAVAYKNMRGLIGSLAAIGGIQEGDYTYELLSYRKPDKWGSRRLLDTSSIIAMDQKHEAQTFNNLDRDTGQVLIAPHGPDPVLYGVRGETAEAVYKASMMIKTWEPVERWVIFRSNQGTDDHLRPLDSISLIKPYKPAIVRGEIVVKPRTIQGGHVIFGIGDGGRCIDCAAYEPTGNFRKPIRKLILKDTVKAYGGAKDTTENCRVTLNLEKLEVLKLTKDLRMVNPCCPTCGGSMESMGRDKGFRCRKCGFKDRHLGKKMVEIRRKLKPGLYIPPPRAQRHLTKPLRRYGREKGGKANIEVYDTWHWP